MEELKKITDQLEYLFLMKIADMLDAKTVELPVAKELARKFLAMEPFSSFEDAQKKVHEFATGQEFLTGMVKFIDGYHEEMKKDELIEKMRTHMKAGNIDEALQVVKE